MKVLGIEFKKSHVILLSASLLVGGFFYPFYTKVNEFTSLTKLSDGAQVCFSRVVQSFTARMVGDASSAYLSDSFLNLTGQCYSDLLENYQNALGTKYEAIGSKVSRLSNELVWFNQKLDTKVIDLSGNSGIGNVLVQNKFKVLETANEGLLTFMDGKKNTLLNNYTLYGAAVLSAFILMLIGLFYEIRSSLSSSSKSADVERRAEKEMRSRELTAARVEKIVADAIAVNNLENTQELFTRFSEELYSKSGNSFVVPNAYDEQAAVESAKDQYAKESENAGLSKLNLSNFTSKIIERLKPQIYAYGVLVDSDVDEDICLWAKEEGLLQVIFDSFSKCLKASIKSGEQARLKINAKTLGGTVVLRVLHNGADFTQRELISVKKRGYENGLSTEVMIMKELMDDFGGKLELTNKKSQMKEIKLIFKRAKNTYATNAKTLKRVEKGTKKELKERMASSVQ